MCYSEGCWTHWAKLWTEQAEPRFEARGDMDVASPPIVARDFVNRPLLTGNKIIDTLIPIGKGQRQLLIGDNGLGKEFIGYRYRG